MPRVALCLTSIFLLLTTGCISISSNDHADMEEVVLQEADHFLTSDRFLVLDISGTISLEKKGGFLSEGTSMVEDVHDALRAAREDDDIRALIVRIDSPGGSVTASEIIRHEIETWKKETGKPTVALMMDTAASGGYLVATAADRIAAHPTTVTGSIGVILLTLDAVGLENLVGIQVGAITSGPHKDILSPHRAMTDDERALLQEIVDQMYEQFVDHVADARNGLDREQVKQLADGRIYTAQQALDAGLIDEIDYMPEMIDSLAEKLGLDDVEVVAYRRDPSGEYNIYSQAPVAPKIDIDLIDAGTFTGSLRPGFHYLWLPGAMPR